MARQPSALQPLLDFAQADLSTYRPGDWLNLRDDLKQFLIYTDPDPAVSLAQMTEQELMDVQGEVNALLRDVIAQRDERKQGRAIPTTDIMFHEPFGMRPLVGSFPGPWKEAHVLHLTGSVRDRILARVIFELYHQTLEQVRICPGCGLLFARVGKQAFHSRECAIRHKSRQWRKTPKGKASERARLQRRQAKTRPPAARGTATG